MKLGSRGTIVCGMGTTVVFLLAIASISAGGQAARSGQAAPTGQAQGSSQAAPAGGGQTGPAPQVASGDKQPLAGEFFKNVQVLRDIPVDEFMGTMGFISASLSLNCLDCHVNESASDFAKYAEDTPIKATARKMILMVNTINKENFGGARVVTCYTCHRSDVRPKFVPSLAEQYGTPPDPDPNDIEIIGPPDPAALSTDQVLDKYIRAIGGTQKLAGLTSFAAKGTYAGYDTDFGKVPAEVYAKAPNQRTTVVHPPGGDSTTAFDGHTGWIAATNTQLPIDTLTGGELDGVTLDAELSFPAAIKQDLTRWRAGFPPTALDGHNVQVIQGNTPGGVRVKLFFDKDSGLLLRLVRFANTAVGLNPTQIDYSDYRDVAGVKMPFHYTVTWTDGRSEFELTDVQPNVAIDPAKFGKPAPPKRVNP
jgi:photosynthetic reaction center cytochrome c subunit